MISDREVNTIYFSERLKIDPRFTEASNRIFSKLDSLGAKYIFLPNTKDIWARDYMPIQVNETRFIEFRYDPDYLQGTGKDRREIKTYPDIVCDSIGLKTKKTDIILDGGNVVKSEDSIILTDKIVWENKKHYSEKQLLNSLHELFEVDKVVLIP
jgi:agmatine/peptidylarginine deiminase